MSNLVEHAERELALCGQTAEDPDYAKSIVEAVRAFTTYYGHSGGSASIAIDQLTRLLRHENLAPLTSDPADWMDRSEQTGHPLWQNRRNSKYFSDDGGQTWYGIDGQALPGADPEFDAYRDEIERTILDQAATFGISLYLYGGTDTPQSGQAVSVSDAATVAARHTWPTYVASIGAHALLADREPTIHAVPPGQSALMPCCGRTPFEVLQDRMTLIPEAVTCTGRKP